MLPELNFITLATKDLGAARRFYKDGLGWEPLADVEGEVLFFQVAAGLILAFFDAAKFAEDMGGVEPPTVSGVTLSQNVGSNTAVEHTMERLVECGGRIVRPARESAFGGIYNGHVADPNGVIWEIAYNPGWRIGEHGKVELG